MQISTFSQEPKEVVWPATCAGLIPLGIPILQDSWLLTYLENWFQFSYTKTEHLSPDKPPVRILQNCTMLWQAAPDNRFAIRWDRSPRIEDGQVLEGELALEIENPQAELYLVPVPEYTYGNLLFDLCYAGFSPVNIYGLVIPDTRTCIATGDRPVRRTDWTSLEGELVNPAALNCFDAVAITSKQFVYYIDNAICIVELSEATGTYQISYMTKSFQNFRKALEFYQQKSVTV